MLRQADAIFIEEIRRAGVYDEIRQAFVVLLPVRSVGVMGDCRTYEQVCVYIYIPVYIYNIYVCVCACVRVCVFGYVHVYTGMLVCCERAALTFTPYVHV